MDLIFEMSWNHPANNILVILFIITSIAVPVYFYNKTQSTVRLFMIGWGVFALVYTASSLIMAFDHYKFYTDYRNNDSKLKVIEGYLKSIDRRANTDIILEIGSNLVSYHSRTGIGCQGDIGWGKKHFIVGSYFRMHFFPVKKDNEQFIVCLAKLESKG